MESFKDIVYIGARTKETVMTWGGKRTAEELYTLSPLKQFVLGGIAGRQKVKQLDSKIQYISSVSFLSTDKLIKEFFDKKEVIGATRNECTKGMIFCLNPYIENQYIELSVLENKLLKQKTNCIKRIAKLAGATRISTKTYYESKTSSSSNTKMDGNVITSECPVGGNFEIGRETKNSQLQNYEINASWPENIGKVVTEETYNSCLQIAMDSGLENDDEIKEILWEINPKSGSLPNSLEYTLELSKESEKKFDLLSGLKANEIIELGVKYNSIIKDSKVIKMNVVFHFSKEKEI